MNINTISIPLTITVVLIASACSGASNDDVVSTRDTRQPAVTSVSVEPVLPTTANPSSSTPTLPPQSENPVPIAPPGTTTTTLPPEEDEPTPETTTTTENTPAVTTNTIVKYPSGPGVSFDVCDDTSECYAVSYPLSTIPDGVDPNEYYWAENYPKLTLEQITDPTKRPLRSRSPYINHIDCDTTLPGGSYYPPDPTPCIWEPGTREFDGSLFEDCREAEGYWLFAFGSQYFINVGCEYTDG